uniref:G_PROTEIN_RECEP_F1_2 domain-containing protein n=1 Tax=Ascaris lumbricoides TaxID=6252 RepID=A0A0M3HRK0_ASCLU
MRWCGAFLLLFIVTPCEAVNVTCAQATTALQAWATLLLVVPTVINIVSAVFAALTIVQIIRLRRITDGIQSSTNWLTRTAVRASLGPTAKRALMEYARKKPGLEQYVLAPPPVASTDSGPPQDIGSRSLPVACSRCEAAISSTNWLTRTAVRASLGPTAKRALMEYARKKPGLEQYVLAPPPVASTDSGPPQDIGSVR